MCNQNIRPAFEKDNIAIAFSVDQNYLPYLKVAIKSLLANLCGGKADIIILHDCDIEKDAFLCDFNMAENTSIRFLYIDKNQFSKNHSWIEHLTVAALYRLLLPEILRNYDKVIYLDVDIVIQGNIAELYNINLGECWLGAVADVKMANNPPSWNMKVNAQAKHWAKKYGFEPWQGYFNSGVLVMGLAALRAANVIERLVAVAQDPYTVCADQDALNIVCKGHVKYIDKAWNYQIELMNAQADCFVNDDVKIYHYSSASKPWNCPYGDEGKAWWKWVGSDDSMAIVAKSLERKDQEWAQKYSELKHSLEYKMGRAIAKPFRAIFGRC